MMTYPHNGLDGCGFLDDHAPVAVNPAIGFGDSENKGGQPPTAAIFTSVTHHKCVHFMAGRGGDTFGYAGFLCTGSPTPPCACHPHLAMGERVKTYKGLPMFLSILSAFRALITPRTIPVSTLPTQAEARALAALLVAHGRSAVIVAASPGYTVSEVDMTFAKPQPANLRPPLI
ncbi:hypothetical protein [Chitinimonas sp. BJB300]|nr:hypothetical protein [Chitinimonas sp. BJB300]TSJ91512.1 hypothetical protein FG002_004365 [Chitinimonas sp. BJB300]